MILLFFPLIRGGGTIHFEAKRSDFKRTFDKIMTKKRDKAIADEKANQDFSHLLINARNHLVPAAKATGLPDASNKHVTSNKAAAVAEPVPVPVASTPITSTSSKSSSNMTKELEETLRKVKRKNGEANGDSHQASASS